MAMQYLRMTKLHSVSGRIDYISNPERQENLLAYDSSMDRKMWSTLGQQNQRAFKNNARGVSASGKCIEAREIIFHLPHMFAENPESVVQQIKEDWIANYKTDCAVALHWNHDKTNLHVHLIFSERERMDPENIKYATRNMYYDENWKRCKKDESVHIIKKGDVMTPMFSEKKNSMFKSYSWLEKDLKEHYAYFLQMERFKNDGLHMPQQKINKYINPEKATQIQKNNELVREFNKKVDTILTNGMDKGALKEITEPLVKKMSRNTREQSNALRNALKVVSERCKLWIISAQELLNEWWTARNQRANYSSVRIEREYGGFDYNSKVKELNSYGLIERVRYRKNYSALKSEIKQYEEKNPLAVLSEDEFQKQYQKVKNDLEDCNRVIQKRNENTNTHTGYTSNNLEQFYQEHKGQTKAPTIEMVNQHINELEERKAMRIRQYRERQKEQEKLAQARKLERERIESLKKSMKPSKKIHRSRGFER